MLLVLHHPADRDLEGLAKLDMPPRRPYLHRVTSLPFGWCGRSLRGLPARQSEAGQLEKLSPYALSTTAASTRWTAFRTYHHHRAMGMAEYAL